MLLNNDQKNFLVSVLSQKLCTSHKERKEFSYSPLLVDEIDMELTNLNDILNQLSDRDNDHNE